MSTRNIRKIVGGNVLPPPEDDSDYEPLYASATKDPKENKYLGLCSLSASESDPEKESCDKESEEEIKPVQDSQKKKKKKKQKEKKGKSIELDEIDKSLREVNALLGTPPPAPVVKPEGSAAQSLVDTLFGINNKHLNASYELRRLLGPDSEEEAKKRRNRGLNYVKRGLIIPVDEKFRKVGLSMSLAPSQKKDGCNYFTIDHDQTYQKHHRMFLRIVLAAKDDFPDLNVGEAVENMHIEEILQVTEVVFAMEEYERAKKLIEKIVAYLQFIAHPLFRITERNVRLEYKILENRVYHVAMLKYIYMMTNSACHRTALELSKVLLNLDPSDPLALIILVDMLALRAREHQWLIDLINYWKAHRDADFMFNLLYSNALAHFHVVKKKKGDMAEADKVLQYAMKRFPLVVPELYKVTNNKNQLIDESEMFKNRPEMSKSLKDLWQDLLKFYTLFTASKWREPEVWAWFNRNALYMVEQHKINDDLQKYVKIFSSQLATFLRTMPQQIVRHFQVIKFMNIFVFDEIIFTPRPGVASYNPEPWPSEDINRYSYKFVRTIPVNERRAFGVFTDLVRSIVPDYVPPQPTAADEDDEPPQWPPRRNGQDEGERSMTTVLNVVREFINVGLIDANLLEQLDSEDDDRWDFAVPDNNAD